MEPPFTRIADNAPPDKEEWIPADALRVSARNDLICVVYSGNTLRCTDTPPVTVPPSAFVDNVNLAETGPWDRGPVYVSKQDGSVTCCSAGHYTDTSLDALGNDITALAVGRAHACAIKREGSVWCLGSGVLGNGQKSYADDNPQPPLQVVLSEPGLAIAAGLNRTCVVSIGGNVWCWGETAPGTVDLSPVKIDITSTVAITAGAYHTCALRDDKSVWCWGSNRAGESGYSPTGDPLASTWDIPHKVSDIGADVTMISAGFFHTCARKSDDTIWCWGSSGYGQFGNNHVSNTVPTVLRGCE